MILLRAVTLDDHRWSTGCPAVKTPGENNLVRHVPQAAIPVVARLTQQGECPLAGQLVHRHQDADRGYDLAVAGQCSRQVGRAMLCLVTGKVAEAGQLMVHGQPGTRPWRAAGGWGGVLADRGGLAPVDVAAHGLARVDLVGGEAGDVVLQVKGDAAIAREAHQRSDHLRLGGGVVEADDRASTGSVNFALARTTRAAPVP